MARAHNETNSLRFSRRESERVVAALLLSLLAHLVIWGGYSAGHKLGWWQKLHPPAWLQRVVKKNPLPAQTVQNIEPTIFVDVSHADTEAPQQTKYYSNKNSRAANPDAASANVPQINGKQKDVPKTEDVPKVASKPTAAPKSDDPPQLTKLQPSMPPPQPQVAATEPDETPQKPGDLDPIRPKKTTPPAKQSPQSQPERPRTLRQALAQRDQLPGQQMQQAGGVPRRALWSSLDAKATPFGDYDRAIIEAVSQRWYDLLDSRRFAQDRTGKVILRFKLKTDGTIIEMQTLENTVGELLGYLCQEAIEEAAPFAKWPPDMVRMIGANYREISFTFYYY
jgi:outer membrane biosynthesis protein TonB